MEFAKTPSPINKSHCMKLSKSDVNRKARDALELRFEPLRLTSFAGLLVFQRLFATLQLKDRLWVTIQTPSQYSTVRGVV